MLRIAPLVYVLICLAGCAGRPADLVLVRGGTFQMGNTFADGDTDEQPLHEVTLDDFLFGRHEVTVAQFEEFVDQTGYQTTAETGDGAMVFVNKKVETRPDANWRNPYYEQDPRHPVVCVSWYDAVAYCNWRSRAEGLTPCYAGEGDAITCDFTADGYRLPTEAEWEYAARDRGKPIRYAWGDGEPYIAGRPAGNTKDQATAREFGAKKIWHEYDDGYAYTSPAANFAPNELGIHDLSGNVYEWCWDWYGDDYYTRGPQSSPTGPPAGELRACRDCGFVCPIYQECVASRGKAEPTLTFSWGGFRMARSLPIERRD